MDHVVELNKRAEKSLHKAPPQVQQKMAFWKAIVEMKGINLARQIKGFHDEPLYGSRTGERSIRLNIQWRAIYLSYHQADRRIVRVVEIVPHKY